MMRKELALIIILLTVVLPADVEAQSELERHIIGVWKPAKIYDIGAVIPDASKQAILTMQKKLLDSKFIFKEDHNFLFESSFEEMAIKNGHWKILADNGQVVIQEWTDKDKERSIHMGITVLLKDDKTIFVLEETFFAFEMVRVSEDSSK